MNKYNFAHLHVHTEYSLLDGSIKLNQMMEEVKSLNMDSVAITDHGSMFGVVEFYKQAKKHGVKPILGSEVYVAMEKYTDRDPVKDKRQYHLILLAENNKGYQNLMKIVSEGYINGFYYRPRVDHDVLRKYSEGIIALSACLSGEVPRHIMNNNYKKAKEIALIYKDIFGKDNFFLEIQDHGIEEQRHVNRELIRLSREEDIPLVATNDAHYLKRENAEVHDVLLCIQTGRTVQEENRMKFPSNEFYLKSPEEMEMIFHETPDALKNTGKIAERCNVELDFGSLHLPGYDVPEGWTNREYLRKLIKEGLKERYDVITDEIKERFNFEMNIIEEMDYVDYFLIVWDFIRFAKEQDIEVGPGRGSAAGSIVSYGLGIIDIDPIEHGLIFERFLNPERVSMPDIDIDFCYERREEVIDYVIEKYGDDRVAQIVTFGTMAARGAIRDVGRAIDMPYGQVDYVAKQIPLDLGMTIDRALKVNKKLKSTYDDDKEIKRLIDFALDVEGLPRHTSTHAAGVIISKEPVTNYVPLTRNGDAIATQFDMNELEELGLLKMDFLGLRTLTVIRDATDLIKENYGVEVKFDKEFNYEDPEVLAMFARAETLGIFQFESAGMRSFLKELKPDVFENLIAANSLYRPGPMNQIPTFVEWKHDPSKITYLHPKLEDVLDVTYGCIVYQEQVMEIVQKIGGYSLGRADILRRAMGKKNMEIMEEERQNFIYGLKDEDGELILPGAIRNGVNEETASAIYDLMLDFANYAFNKSHSAAYAVVAYRTAWLKHYYPVEFMAALISSIMGNTSSVTLYIRECKRLNIEILKPDINESRLKFTVSSGQIRFGLSAVKNVGEKFICAIEEARIDGPFKSLNDFIERIINLDSGAMNKRAVEALIKCGAMDSLGGNRAQYLSIYEGLIDGISKDKKMNVKGQFSIFDIVEDQDWKKDDLPDLKDFPKEMILNMEKEITGIYISGHPLEPFEDILENITTTNTIELNSMGDELDGEVSRLKDGNRVTIGGIITLRKNMLTKNNNMMAFITLEDLYGDVECIVFPSTYDRYLEYLEEDSFVIINGKISTSETDGSQIIVEQIRELKEPSEEKLYLKLNTKNNISLFENVKDVLRSSSGRVPVFIYFENEKESVMADEPLWIERDERLEKSLISLLGKESVKFIS